MASLVLSRGARRPALSAAVAVASSLAGAAPLGTSSAAPGALSPVSTPIASRPAGVVVSVTPWPLQVERQRGFPHLVCLELFDVSPSR